jgi:GDPmannose 4,6-dehydratase
VWGLIRRSSDINTNRIDHIYTNKNLFLRYYDLTDSCNIVNIINEIKLTYQHFAVLEIYNLAAMSHVKVSFEMPEYTGNVDGLVVLIIL